MLIVLSPAKTLDTAPAYPASLALTKPQFYADAKALAASLATLTEAQLGTLMDISPKLAALNVARFESFAAGTHPAAWMFRGDVYDGLDIDTLPAKALPALEQRLRILSGLYGLLRPSDAMHPYRLEMGTAWKNPKGKDLYAFWGARIAQALNKAADEAGTDLLLNLASVEYHSAIDRKALKPRIVTAHFKERKNGVVKVVSLFAKRARGTMARWVIEQKAQEKHLPDFNQGGYRFEKSLSDNANLIFVRG